MKKNKTEVLIIDAARTAIGSPFRGLKDFTAAQLAAAVISGLVKRAGIRKESIAELFLGNTVSAGQGQNAARQAVALAGLPLTIPAYSVNFVCGSGLQSVILGAQSIMAKDSGIVIAAGAESVTHAPFLAFKNGPKTASDKEMVESNIYDGLRCLMTGKHMGELCEALAAEQRISRREQDLYALESNHKAGTAQANGKFAGEIIPLSLAADERPKKDIDLETLARYPAAFRKEGTITAGNASVPCDGAAALALASAALARREKIKPMAKILGYVSVAVEPEKVFTAAVKAIPECLKASGLTMKDIDLFEVCESFAAQAVFTRNALSIPPEKMNIFGGDVALGHPLGSAGARILVTLLHALKNQKKKIGLAAVCLGGGGGVAMAVERI